MSIEIIDILKPKNGLSFPVVEAIDVFVDGFDNLADAVSHFATDEMIEAINTVLSGKASTSDVTTATANLQAQINNIVSGSTADSEVINARVGADGTSYQTLKARLDAENAKAFQFRGELSDLNYTTIAEADQIGCYNSRSTTTAELEDKPDGVTGAFSLMVNNWSSGDSVGIVQILIAADGTVYQRFISSSGTVVINWASTADKTSQFRGELAALGYTSISQARKIGCYSSLSTTTADLPDKPTGVTGAFSLIVNSWLSDGQVAPVQILITNTGDVWQRFLNVNGNVVVNWASSAPTIAEHTQKITAIEEGLSVRTEVAVAWQSNKFWDISSEETAELKDITYWNASPVIPVSEGEVYTVQAYQGTSHKVRVWTCCDDSMNIIAMDDDAYNENYLTRTFTVPSGATKLVMSNYRSTNLPHLFKEISKFKAIEDEIDSLESELESDVAGIESRIDTINETISQFYSFATIQVTDSFQKFWAFETGTAVLTDISGSMWTAVSQPIAVQPGEMYKVTGNQGASHKVRIWIVTNDDMEVIATAEDHYESPNAGTLYTDLITIPEGGTKLLLTSTRYADSPYIWVYKAVNDKKPLKGLNLSLLGDSISAYTGTIPTGNDAYYTGSNSGVTSPNQMWWKVLCDKTDMIPLVINAWSGSGITQLTDSSHLNKVPMSDTSRCQALHTTEANPDVILIAGGVNDYTYAQQASQKPSGWEGKTAPVNGNSFDETYAVMIKNIQTAYPNAVVVCLSTWFTMRGTDNGYTLLNGEGLTQTDYDEAIERIAKYMRVPYINVERCGFSRSNFYPTYAEDSSSIPTHPNARGQRIMGELLANVLPQIINAYTWNVPEE